ncbi:LuxR C-terminal-related transcriptional regulator [Pseudonocardia broussonetiae]|uniref:HTH luxR-type domain-containing protein n=1 Tax=Pseudonocardia broussonetiae TaxID=2736640 RepID=A0A6M6JRB2_9PSEU|nr:LuxR C-terminal-related transcriptional regulator [Pseudonocardia broussonetiae]QJY49182.1 hypothetical protein HOP40_28345 [Pseudonocardia broussonetiae]
MPRPPLGIERRTGSPTVPRPRLYAHLAADRSVPVTVVAAAAGWGKTVLAASWAGAGAGGRPVAWAGLSPPDDDVVPFWSRLAEALRTVVGRAAAEALHPLTQGSSAGPDPAAAFLAASLLVEQPVVLVLDDLQRITSAAVHEGLVRLVVRAPPMLSLLVLTRRDPPWPLTRLKIAGAVRQVPAAELAFSTDEAVDLFARLGLAVDRTRVDRLVERTDGWPAALRLAALHLTGSADDGTVLDTFSGDHHAVAGYLIDEVLAQQPAELVRHLERISVADRVCADLAAALTGVADGEQLLAELSAEHLVVPTADLPGRWYRMHRLLGDVVRSRPAAEKGRRDRHRRAAEWFRRADLPLETIRSATAGRLWSLAAVVVGRHALGRVLRGQAAELEAVLATLPRPVLVTHVELALGLAAARIVQGDRNDVAGLLSAARAGTEMLSDVRAARAGVLIGLVEGGFARLRGRWDLVGEVYRALPRDPVQLARSELDDTELVPIVVDSALGLAALLDDDLDTAVHRFRAALAVESPAPTLPHIEAASYLALSLCERGDLDAAQTRARRALARASASGLEAPAQVVAAHLTMARVALDRADVGEADDWLTRAVRAEAGSGEPHVVVLTALVRAARHGAAGDHERALSVLRGAAAAIDVPDLPSPLRRRLRTAEAVVLARLGDRAAARAVAEDDPEETPLASARLLLVLGDVPAAVAARRGARPSAHPRARIVTGVLDAALALAHHDEELALERIEQVLTRAATFALRGPLLEEAAVLRPLLELRLERGSAVPAFLVDLLRRMDSVPGRGDRRTGRTGRTDNLTDRERTVLRYLASTMTNAEIAAELRLSVNTIKTHERALYRKLGATNRRGAVARGRVLGFL